MASCADCVHVEVCQKTRIMNPAYDYAPKCNDFKDRSQFVELPCRPDDSLFVIVPDRNGNPTIEEYTVYAVIKKRDRTILETGIGRFIWGKEPCWLSYEEADQALKERKTMKGDKERRAIIVLDKLNTDGRFEVDRDELRAAVRVAKAALAKRIPLRAGAERNDDDQDCFLCPSCHAPVGVADAIDLTDDYCYSCGQALDWDSFI